MAATQISNLLVEYDYSSNGGSPSSRQVPTGLSVYNYQIDQGNFVTLSDNTAAYGPDIEGFLYVPDLPANGACDNVTRASIPSNVTRLANLPSRNDFSIIAFGPWTTRDCVYSYLDNANGNGARAFYTFLPSSTNMNNTNATTKGQFYQSWAPPNASSPAWDIGDGGAWKSTYRFPVYALNSQDANTLMIAAATYSGNITSSPSGMELLQSYGPTANVRMYSQAVIPSSASLPSLWVFLLIVLGILLAVLIGASVIMRFVQNRRRRELQRMIANGEVNLEALGVARVKVTEDILNKMPIYVYVEHGGVPGAPHPPALEPAGLPASPAIARPSRLRGLVSRTKTPATVVATRSTEPIEEKSVLFPQESCPICLDDYENHVTPVKWLPCSHIFHPACIDPLLREYSSLCPICKAGVLPKDYVPEVTNVMVRRERLNRRFRDIERRERERALARPDLPPHFHGVGRFVRVTQPEAAPTASTSAVPAANQYVEMNRLQPSQMAEQSGPRPSAAVRMPSAMSTNSAARRPENVSREEWARQRAAALVGTSETVEQAEQREEARRPMWRRVLGPVFPNLR